MESMRKQTFAHVQVPMVIVGNKLDLDSERVVSQSEGKDLAASYNCPWLEASAKARIRVEDSFFELVLKFQGFKGSG